MDLPSVSAAVLTRLQNVWKSSRYEGLPERSRERFDIIAQRALEAAKVAPPPERRGDTIARLFDLLEAISRRGAPLSVFPSASPFPVSSRDAGRSPVS